MIGCGRLFGELYFASQLSKGSEWSEPFNSWSVYLVLEVNVIYCFSLFFACFLKC